MNSEQMQKIMDEVQKALDPAKQYGEVKDHLAKAMQAPLDCGRPVEASLNFGLAGGERADVRLLATLGLCEIDAGNPAGALQYLEPAVAGGVVRPRAYHELARLRFAELRRGLSPSASFTFAQVAPIIEPLRRALAQAPPLPEVFELLGEGGLRETVYLADHGDNEDRTLYTARADARTRFAKRFAVAQVGRARQLLHLTARVVDVVFARHLVAGELHQVAERVAEHRAAAVPDVHRPCRIG